MKIGQLISYILEWTSLIWLLQTQALAFNCTGNQITLVDKNKKFVQCAPCPPCAPGQEYTIACHTTAFVDTVRACINCPRGKFSRRFDTKPCADCRRCSKKHIKIVCTPYRNAKCGDCLAGYFYSKVVFGCVECDRCCNYGKDERPLGCSKVGMCKPRLNGCPTTVAPRWLTKRLNKSKIHPTPNLKASTVTVEISPFAEQDTTPTPNQTTKPHQDQPQESAVPKAPSVLPIKEGQNKEEDSDHNLLITVVVVFDVIFVIFIAVVVVLICKQKRNNRPQFLSLYSRPVEHQPPRSPNDMLLKDLFEQEVDVCDEVCENLYKLRGGMYDFDRIATKFQLSPHQRQAIENIRHTPDGSPPRGLITALCSSIPETTVKQFAQKAKEINRNDVYQLLEPFFTIQQSS